MRPVLPGLRHSWQAIAAVLVVLLVMLGLMAGAWREGWQALWASPDQRGAWLLRHGHFDQASAAFSDPVWRGIALMRAGRFADAAQSFAQADTADAMYDRGNALVMIGQYSDAVAQYDHALTMRPDWPNARVNRALAQARANRFANLQGEEADQEKAAPDEAYNRDRNREQADQAETGTTTMSDQAIRALWLRRVQTKPADFLRARFAYQLEHAGEMEPGE